MSRKTIVGIDPGLVNTGMVVLRIDTRRRFLISEHFVIEGDEDHATQAAELLEQLAYEPNSLFIEKYRERGQNLKASPKMRELEASFRKQFPAGKLIDNTGSKKVVTRNILQVLGLDSFPSTHHQDLQAAARILVYGMLKDERLNELLYTITNDFLAGREWPVEKV